MQSPLRPGRCTASLSCRPRGRHLDLKVQASVHARWCLDVRYGCKTEATALLQEWVQTVGSKAGLTAQNTRLSSGCLGVPESRLEMEVTFDSMADWEAFLGALPFQEHKAWTQRIQGMVVDGSPMWQVHRSVPVMASGAAHTAASVGIVSNSPKRQAQPAASPQLVFTDQVSPEDIFAWQHSTGKPSDRQQRQQEQTSPAAAPAEGVPLDWKGEPMKLNPGDKLPFKFL